jgi:hypothetical protein
MQEHRWHFKHHESNNRTTFGMGVPRKVGKWRGLMAWQWMRLQSSESRALSCSAWKQEATGANIHTQNLTNVWNWKLNSMALVHMQTVLTDGRLSAKLVPTFEDRRCHVVSATDPHGPILGFLDWRCYFFFQVSPQLYSRGWVDPVPDPLLLRKSGSAGNQTQTSGSVACSSGH